MAQIAVVTPDRDGEEVTPVAASAGGDSFPNNGRTILFVENADASAHEITIASQVSDPAPGQAAADDVKSVPAGEIQAFGPYSPRAYNDAEGLVQLSYDGITGLTVWAVSIP